MSDKNAPLSGGRLVEDMAGGPAVERVEVDAALVQQVRRGESGPVVRLWTNGQCLVSPGNDARRPGFAEAAAGSAAAGWPVAVRGTGGATVPHAPGILLLALVYPRPDTWSIETGYHLLCAPIEAALRAVGLDPEMRAVPGSFCDGRHNVAVGGRKVAGTAQRWLSANAGMPGSRNAVLGQVMLLLDPDLEAATDALIRFQTDLGLTPSDPKATVAIRDLLAGSRYGTADVAAALKTALMAELA